MLMLVALGRSAEGLAAAAAAAALRGRDTPGMPLSSSSSLAYGGTAVRHRHGRLLRQEGRDCSAAAMLCLSGTTHAASEARARALVA